MIIGISGKKQSGKDLTGKVLRYLSFKSNFPNTTIKWLDENFTNVKATNYLNEMSNWQIEKFANALKDTACQWIGCTREQLEDEEFKNTPLGPEWDKTVWHVQTNNNIISTNMYREAAEADLIHYQEYYTESDVYMASEYIEMTPRLFMQLLGNDCGRNIIHPNIWINALFSKYRGEPPYFGRGKAFDGTSWSGSGYCQQCNKDVTDRGLDYFLCEDCCKPESYKPNWIITDVRYPNEAQAIKDRGGIVIRVERDSELEYKHTGEDVLSMLNGMGYEDIDDDFSEEAVNEGFKWSDSLQKWSFDEDNFQEHKSETYLDNYKHFDHVINNNGTTEELIEKIKNLNLI